MKIKEQIILQQKDFIEGLKSKTSEYVAGLEKDGIQTILLSGSVSRGDYFPGDFGGMVDLTVITKAGANFDADSVFGKDEEPEIPYHCVTNGELGFQIKIMERLMVEDFFNMDEAQKFALLESQIIYDENGIYENELEKIKEKAKEEIATKFEGDLGYVYYLISDYKKDRWIRREANIQLHENLNAAIRVAIRCLYYMNGSYTPAEDRMLYYSFSLEKLPSGYKEIVEKMCSSDVASFENYEMREKAFREGVLKFLEG